MHAAFDVQGLNHLRHSTRAKTPEGVKETARQFESLFLQSMMKTMRATVGENTFLGSNAEKTYTELLDQQLAHTMANHKNGLGFAQSIEKQLARQMGVDLNANNQQPNEDRLENSAPQPIQSSCAPPSFPTLNIFSKDFHQPQTEPIPPTQTLTKEPTHSTSPSVAMSFSPLFEVESYLNPPLNTPIHFEKNLRPSVENNTFSPSPTSTQAVPISSNAPSHVQHFIESVWDDAQKAAEQSGLNPIHIVAHAALESGWGKFQPGGKDNPSFNLFGIKANENWEGKRVVAKTTEFENGALKHKYQSFRAYDSYAQAFSDYAQFLQNNPRYANVFKAQSAKDFAQDLQKAGYATDPQYALKLQRTIENTEAFLRS